MQDVRESMIGKVYVYHGGEELNKGQKVEVVHSDDESTDSGIVCDCKTTERFLKAKLPS